MNELDMLKIIHKKLNVTDLLGSDCAKLQIPNCPTPLHITHDTLVEDVHFSLKTTTPFELALKCVAVNISDLCAALAKPLFISISLSLPANISSEFVEEFYEGINEACQIYGCVVSGGDLTKSEKIMISICAIGIQEGKTTVGRNCAQKGDIVLITGKVGSSSIGLIELLQNPNIKDEFTKAHLCPEIGFIQAKQIATLNPPHACIMDTSDGLADAIFKISQVSNVELEIDGEKLPKSDNFSKTCTELKLNEKEQLLFGAEDFGLLITIEEKYLNKLNLVDFTIIGKVKEEKENPISTIKFKEKEIELTEETIKTHAFKHFED